MAEWQPFYTTVATVAATLTGLLFVGLSLNRERLASEDNRVFRRLALQGFGDYLFVLGIGMCMLIPHLDCIWIGRLLLGLGALRLIRLVRFWRHPAYRHLHRRSLGQRVSEYAMPLVSCLGLCAIAVLVRLGYYTPIYYLVFIVIELITTASRGAWKLLMLDEGAPQS